MGDTSSATWRSNTRNPRPNDREGREGGMALEFGSSDDDYPWEERRFGCPYYKRNSDQYEYCVMRQIPARTNYVLRHIRRYHSQPIHCPVCGLVFGEQSTKEAHMREKSCEPFQFTHPGVTLPQQKALKHIPRDVSPAERWFYIWDILFPGEPRPDSPYVDDPMEEIGSRYLKRLNQQQPGSSTTAPRTEHREQAPASNGIALENELGFKDFHNLRDDFERPGLAPYDQVGPVLQHASDTSFPVPGHQSVYSRESGSRMWPGHSKSGFIGSPQLDPYRLGDSRGYLPHPEPVTKLRPHEDGRRVYNSDATLQTHTEVDAQAQLPSFPFGDPPEHVINSLHIPSYFEDTTVEDMEVGGVLISRHIPGSTMAVGEECEMKAPPRLDPEGQDRILTPPCTWPAYLDEAPVETLEVSPDPGLGMLDKTQPPPHIFGPHPQLDEAGSSPHGETSCHDSGYASLGSRDKARGKDVDDNASIYSMESISPESRSRYITAFSNRLGQDIWKLARNSAVPEGSRELLLEWIKTFALKLQGESSTRTKREASVFIRKYRRYIEISPSLHSSCA